jgi:leucyl-tRNA synthetase
MGPLDAAKPWTDTGVKGVYNFLRRVNTFFADLNNITEGEDSKETLKILHQTIKKVESDINDLKFNTAISQMMVFTNHCYKVGKVSKSTASTFVQVLAPYAPHLAEELWAMYGNEPSVCKQPWPKFEAKFLEENSFDYPVSFNGKMRFKINLPVGMPNTEIEKAVEGHESAKKWLDGKTVVKMIIVPKKIINVVVK